MKKQQEQRKQFNRVMELPTGKFPQLIETKRWELQRDMLIEEVEEYDEACRDKDLVKIADALGDIIYVALGAVAEHGIQGCIEEILDEIQRSNMSKVQPNGTVLKAKNGKVMKPSNYFKPDIARIIKNHLNLHYSHTKLEV